MTQEEINNLKENDIIIQMLAVTSDITCSIYQVKDFLPLDEVGIVLLDSELVPEDIGLEIIIKKHLLLSEQIIRQTTQKFNIRCECGAEKCGYNSHSNWCPKR